MEDEGRDRRRKKRGRSNGTGTERGKWKREGDHGCHAVSYSICCSAEQSGAAGGGQASAHRGRGGERRGEEIEGERRGEAISPAPLLHQEGKHSGTGPGEDTITRTHRDTQSHRQREARSIVEVKKESWCGTRVGCNPPPPRRARPGKKK